MATPQHNLRLLRPVPDPIPWYVRVGYNDHKLLENKLSAGDARINRVVIDAAYLKRHASLIKVLQARNAEIVLDPRSAELAMPAGQRDVMQHLPWSALARESDPSGYDDAAIHGIARSIAEAAVSHGFSAVLAPAHYLSTPSDSWIDVDIELTKALRQELDALGGNEVRLYYPLLIPYGWLSSRETMIALAGVLSTVPINAVWLRVSNFQNDKSAAAVRHYIEGARALLSSDRPLIADHVGGLSGLAVLACGAAGGLAHGIGIREGFKVANWQKTNRGNFGVRTRAYVGEADLYIDTKTFGPVLDNPVIRSRMGCKNKQCCPRGLDDMFGNAKGHTINTRFEQLALLAQSTESQRTGSFIRRSLIPTGATLIKLDHALQAHPELQRRIQRKRRFVDDLRLTLESVSVETGAEVRRSRIPRRAPYRPMPAAQQNNQRPTL